MTVVELVAYGALGLSALLLLLFVWQTARIARIERRYSTLIGGHAAGGAVTLGELVAGQGQRIEKTTKDLVGLANVANRLASSVQGSVQHVGLVRFNPFEETGGDQSFALALLDGRGDGIVISSLHSRTVTRFYAKPIKKGLCQLSLSKEESKAVEMALAGE